MHRTRFVMGITALFLTTGIVVTAQHGHSGAPKPPHTTTPAPKAAPSPHSTPKATKTAMATQPKGTKPVSSPKTAHGSSVKPVKTDKPATAKAAKTDKSATTKVAKAEKHATTTSTVTLTPVQEKLTKNTNLAAKLTSRLPEGTDLMLASAGFRNLGQFVAAVNVSNNLKIPFTQLKTKMVTDGLSLGQAIQALKPTASSTIESQRAEYDARGMISESELEPKNTSTSTTPVTTSSKIKAKVKTKKSAQ
ncbi:MAG: hypothetical protein M3P13_03290 [Acidobacteriota bacterium]|nr:hypothetical protein [Acidobacteriota bacterium]